MTGEPERLVTWGEIAKFLNCNDRTAQRWATDRGLPVRRIPGGGRKGSVFAYRAELQEWLDRDQADQKTLPVEPVHVHAVLSRRNLLLGAAGAALAASLVWAFRARAGNPVRAALVGTSLCAWDDMGQLLWKYTFKQSFGDGDPAIPGPGRTIRICDVLADNTNQILFVARFVQPDGVTPRHQLCCFSSRGQLLWTWQPAFSVKFGEDSFNGPWIINDILTRPGSRNAAVWVAVSHVTWRPGVVMALNQRGQASIWFTHAGNIHALASASLGSENYVLAGGINNEYAAASLAILRESGPPSASPQTPGTRFENVDGPTARPHRYFLFPPTELNSASRIPYNVLTKISGPPDAITVVTNEVPVSGSSAPATAMYALTPHLEVQDVAFDNTFAVEHHRLERSGELHHALDACPLLNAPTRVRRWDAASGWTNVEVPPKRGIRPESHV